MAELSDREYERQIEEVINIVNENHDKYLEEQSLLEQAGNRGINAKMRKVLNRIMGIADETTSKKIVYFKNENNEKLHIRTSDGSVVGTITLNRGVEAKIKLVDTKPIFKIFKNNEVYIERDLMSNKLISNNVTPEVFGEVSKTYAESKDMVSGAKLIYELLDNKNYAEIENYIIYSMTELINNNLETAALEQRQVYTEVYVAYQQINKLKNLIIEYQQKGMDYDFLLESLDQEYRSICEKLINAGLYVIPEEPEQDDENLITRL